MSDPITGAEDRVSWGTGVPRCPNCKKNLGENGNVSYTQRHHAHIIGAGLGDVIVKDPEEFMSEACCSFCGTLLDYDDVE